MTNFGFDDTCGTIIGRDMTLYTFYYNGKPVRTEPFDSDQDAVTRFNLVEKTDTARLLRHMAPCVVNTATGRVICACSDTDSHDGLIAHNRAA